MNKPTIYLDLDETLWNTIVRSTKKNNDRTWVKFDKSWYGATKRPIANDLIEFCMSLSPTKVLTNSTRDYAEYFCNAFNFGFSPCDLVTRDDYLEEIQHGWSGWMSSPCITKIVKNNPYKNPNDILIDNLYPDDPGAIEKMKYLGIKPDRFLKIRDFFGWDPEKFQLEYSVLKDKLSELVNNV